LAALAEMVFSYKPPIPQMNGGKVRYLFCGNCQKNSGYKRAFGCGTFFAVILTAGLWFLVMSFYLRKKFL
jgi:hypothetical protein